MPSTLLQITSEFQALDELLEEIGGDVSDPRVDAIVTEWLAELETQMEAKADAYAAYIRELELRAAARREESERLLKAAKTQENTAAWLKDRLKQAMTAARLKKIEGQRYTVSVAANGGKLPLILDDTAPVPVQFLRHPPPVPDTEAIRSALEAGRELEFARLGERGTHLRIR
jgi:hypothetical protein